MQVCAMSEKHLEYETPHRLVAQGAICGRELEPGDNARLHTVAQVVHPGVAIIA
jgi:hypothetical protein